MEQHLERNTSKVSSSTSASSSSRFFPQQAMEERYIQDGLSYKVDDNHYLCTFVWDREGQEKKILKYDVEKLVKLGGVLSMFCNGTIFTMDLQLLKSLLIYLSTLVIVSVCFILLLSKEELQSYDIESLDQLARQINGFVPFVLALYVSLVLNRWWTLRVRALGNLFNALSNTVMVVSTCLHAEIWADLRQQVIRFGMSSVMLVVKAARKDNNLQTLVEQNLLEQEEVDLLQEVMPFQRATTMWVWILRLVDAGFAYAKVPLPRYQVVLSKAMQARDGVQTIHTYLETQLPFAYVHLITLLVNLQNLVFSAKCGAVLSVAYSNGDTLKMVNQVFMCMLVCVIYQGLLIISYVVHDPFGDDLLDFPVVAYTEYVSWSCAAVDRTASRCPALGPSRFGWLIPESKASIPEMRKSTRKSQCQTLDNVFEKPCTDRETCEAEVLAENCQLPWNDKGRSGAKEFPPRGSVNHDARDMIGDRNVKDMIDAVGTAAKALMTVEDRMRAAWPNARRRNSEGARIFNLVDDEEGGEDDDEGGDGDDGGDAE